MSETKKNVPQETPDVPETIEVKKDVLDQLLADMETLKKDNVMLKSVADKSRIAWFEEARQTKGPNHYKIATYNGDRIVAWRTVKDEVNRDFSTGRIYVDQQYEVVTQSGNVVKINGYNNFAEVQYGNPMEVIEVSRRTDAETNAIILKVKDVNGNEFEQDRNFVN